MIRATEMEPHVCDVCRLLDSDISIKLCGYCGMCDAYICRADLNRWGRRIQAWYRRRAEPNYRGVPDYDQHVKVPENEAN